MTTAFLTLYIAGIIGIIGFQFALMAGAPLAHITQGGQRTGSLPTKGRVLAGLSVFVLLGKGMAIASAAGVWPGWPIWTAWIALAVQAIVTLLNWITPSKPERRVWAPITTCMLAAAVIVVFLR